jgi:dTDP-4-dehydrorhamnose 3,5-epimerase
MKVIPTALPEVLILEPRVFEDERGFFMESWSVKTFREVTGLSVQFVQDNHSHSVKNVLRGIHYQVIKPQGKLVRLATGAVFDVAVDLRKSSPNFGKWVGVELSAENKRQLWVPPGFGHAFLVRSESADFLYKTTEYWFKEHERSIAWDDPILAIDWGLRCEPPILAVKDRDAPRLENAEVYP